jgi:hypothetical protein
MCWAEVAGSLAPANAVLEEGLDEHVLVVEEEHGGGRRLGGGCLVWRGAVACLT